MKNFIYLLLFLSILNSNTFEDASKYYKNKQYKKAFELYTQLANRNNANAQYNLALMYYNGIAVAKNVQLAFIWLSSAAEQGHMQAQNMLGYFYEKGIIPELKDEEKAIELYTKSAKQGYDIAQLNLGMYYAKFINKESSKKAFYWYTKAHENGNIVATNNLATIYYL